MNKNLKLIKNFFLVVAPILASSVLGVSPSEAATLAKSSSEIEFTNFSQTASSTFSNVEFETFGDMEGAMASAFANIEIEFLEVPPFAKNESLSLAFGENRDYLGLAEVESEIIGEFDIKAGTNFSFDFSAELNLETSIDNPSAENARASGDIAFLLFDSENNNFLDSFILTGNLLTEGDNDFIALETNDNVNVQSDTNINSGGNQEILEAFVEGKYERNFADETNLVLFQIQRNRVRVTAPEPSTNLALLLSSGVIGVVLKRRRKYSRLQVSDVQ